MADSRAEISAIAARAKGEISAAESNDALASARAKFLGRGDGELTVWRKKLGEVTDANERKELGEAINQAWAEIESGFDDKTQDFAQKADQAALHGEWIDFSKPPVPLGRGHLHPVTLCLQELRDIFLQQGFRVVEGPEVEYDYYNFSLLNIPPGHPVRDSHETFFVDEVRILRTHTSPVQIRAMLSYGAPLRAIVLGRVYRPTWDATHTPMFHNCEGLLIEEDVSFSDLRGTLEYMAKSLLGPNSKIRIRPHYFPFTEPSLEMDSTCPACKGDGCAICKQSGWVEVLGAGMVHPQVLRNGGVDSEKYRGFAFGLGIERLAALKYGVPDIRLLYENDLRLLRQGATT